MKPTISLNRHSKKRQSIIILAIYAVCCLASQVLFPQSSWGQSDNNFHQLEPPIRDSAILPVDFQREIEKVGDQLEANLFEGFQNESNESTTSAMAIEGTPTFVHHFKSQLSDLDMPRVFGSLAIVLGGYFGLVWLTRRFGGPSNGRLPSEVVEVLGQTPFKPGSNLQLVRLGSKLLLLLNSSEGTQTIGEISDPDEVDALCAKCGVSRPKHPALVPQPSTHATGTDPGLNQAANTDLRQILRQLQQVTDGGTRTSVFEA